jgi:oxygen-independent coproporphyrinogen-3 oxidase
MLSLYVHIPFCIKKCIYCDFISEIYSPDHAASYVNALKREISRISSDSAFSTLYIGGGTPTVLAADVLTEITDSIFSELNFSENYEATIEANPGTVDTEKLTAIFLSGINRISIGIQSFNENELVFLGRIHNRKDSEAAVTIARDSGFSNISIDLIYGIPGQSLDSWKTTLKKAVSLSPQHISTYELTVEVGTELYAMMKSTTVSENFRVVTLNEKTIIEMYEYAIDFLTSNGYFHYEISNFARPDYFCRHNLNYWNRGEYSGAGLGAHSLVNNQRYHNTGSIKDYTRLLSANMSPLIHSELIDTEKALSEEFFLGLRKTAGIMLKTLSKSYGIDIADRYKREIKKLTAAGLLEFDSSTSLMKLTRKGLLLSNEVFTEFM